MINAYDDQKETGLAPINEEIKEDRQIVKKESGSEEHYDLPLAIRSRTLLWSVISVICAVLSILLSHFYYIGLVFAVTAVAFAVVSRRVLGFFEKFSIMGIILGVSGFVFGTTALVFDAFNLLG